MRIEDVYGSKPGDLRVLHERVSRASRVLYDTWTHVYRFYDGCFTAGESLSGGHLSLRVRAFYKYSIRIIFFLILSEYTILALRIPFLGTKGVLVLATESQDVFRGTVNLIK
jgi:hypothetical protein